jgi:hypothetical protein
VREVSLHQAAQIDRLTKDSAQQAVRIRYLTDQGRQEAAQNRRLLAQVSELNARQEGQISVLEARLIKLEQTQTARGASGELAEAANR